MPLSRKGNVILNVGAVLGELVGTLFFVFLALGVHAIPGVTTSVLGTGLAFGFSLAIMTYLFFIRSGSHFNTGVTMARAAAWVPGLHVRDYWGPGRLWWDVVFWGLYTAAQIGGALLAVLALRGVDNSSLLAASTWTSPNGNLDGQQGQTLLLLWLLNTILIWVSLVLFSPRMGIQIKVLSNYLVIGATYGAVVLVSIYWGTGSVCNFAIDLALAALIKGNSMGTLWISLVAQVLGAITAFVAFWVGAWIDRVLDVRKHATGNNHLDHSRINALAGIFNFFDVTLKEMALDDALPASATDRSIVAETYSGESYPAAGDDDRQFGRQECRALTILP